MIQALSQARVKVSIAMMVIALILCFLTAWYGKTHQVLFPPSPAPPIFPFFFPIYLIFTFFLPSSTSSFFPLSLFFSPFSSHFLSEDLPVLFSYFLFPSFIYFPLPFFAFIFFNVLISLLSFLFLFLFLGLSFSIFSIPYTFPLSSSQFFHPLHSFYLSSYELSVFPSFSFLLLFLLFAFSFSDLSIYFYFHSYQLSVFP